MKYRVLWYDLDPETEETLGSFLESRGYTVTWAASGSETREHIEQVTFDLVVVDLQGNPSEKLELLEKIRFANPSQDIIVTTSSQSVQQAIRAVRSGAYAYWTKPFLREEIPLTIDRLAERQTLYEEHTRLADENLTYAATQNIYARSLRVFRNLDLETVCEGLLETLNEVTRAQSAVMWLREDERENLSLHGYRGLVDVTTIPLTWANRDSMLHKRLAQGAPLLCSQEDEGFTPMSEPAASMLCPLVRGGNLLGLIHLHDKLGEGFTAIDARHARILTEAGATAVHQAKRLRGLEKVGLRSEDNAAYNMTYFVDYLGRELHKSRRYHRPFCLVEVSLDNVSMLKDALPPETVNEAIKQLTTTLQQSLRDIDVLARVDAQTLYVLIPESDFLSGLSFVRQARQAVSRSMALRRIDAQAPLTLAFGPAAFPRDGDDVDQLFAAARRRMRESSKSLYRRLHLQDEPFWSAFEHLVGNNEHYDKTQYTPQKSDPFSDPDEHVSRRAVFSEPTMDSVWAGLMAEAERQGGHSGWLFLGGAWDERRMAQHLDGFKRLEKSRFKTYVLGHQLPPELHALANVTAIDLETPEFDTAEVSMLFAEHTAYGALTRRRPDGDPIGFHTSDWNLVDGMIHKLQEAYSLQQGPR